MGRAQRVVFRNDAREVQLPSKRSKSRTTTPRASSLRQKAPSKITSSWNKSARMENAGLAAAPAGPLAEAESFGLIRLPLDRAFPGDRPSRKGAALLGSESENQLIETPLTVELDDDVDAALKAE
jgi:hypothetical protein